MKTTKLITLVLLLASNSIIGQEKTSFSINEAVEFALTHNEKIKNADLGVIAAQKKVYETIGIGLPQINLKSEFQHFIDIPVSVVDASFLNPAAPPGSTVEFKMGQEYAANVNLSVSQILFDGSYIVGLQFSKFYQKLAETSLESSKQEVKSLVKEAYYNTIVAQKNLTVIDTIAVTTKTLWDQSKVYFENGFILQEDLDQLEIAFNRIELNKKNAENQLNIAYNLLKLQLGIPLDTEITLTEEFETILAEIESNNPALSSFSVENNINYIMVDQQRVLDEYSLKNEKSKYLPSAYAFFNHTQNAYRSEFDFFQDKAWYPTTIWGLGVSVPITSSGQRIMKVQQAEIKIEQDENTLSQLERSLKFQELQLKAMFMNAYDAMHLEEQNLDLSHKIYNQSIARKAEGAISALQVTQVQNQLLQAEGSYIGAIMQMLSVKIQLDKLYNI